MSPEIWTTGISHPSVAPRMAERAEEAGFDGLFVVDSQNLAGDPFVGLTLAAGCTDQLKLGTGVSNPLTRHPAAAAAAIGSVHVASRGRAVFGVGRGDSALAHLGLSPATVDRTERFVTAVRAYLRGDAVPFDALAAFAPADARPVDELGLAHQPESSRMAWIPTDRDPTPVEVVATGPRMLAMAGRCADRTLLAVGADPERVGWAAGVTRDAGAERVGSFVNVVVDDDIDRGRLLASGGMSTFARFSVMDGTVRSPIDDESRAVLEGVHDVYDMDHHTQSGSAQSDALSGDFMDRFGIIGPTDHCVARLRELVALGLDKLIVVGPSMGADPDASRAAAHRFATEVLPTLR